MCCGCARRCGNSSRPRWQRSPAWTPPDALELLGRAPDPDRAAALSRAKIAAALRRANRRDAAGQAQQIQAALRAPQLRQPPAVQSACAAIVSSQVALITALNAQITELGEVVAGHFGQHPDAEIYASQPGPGVILGARVLAESGDDPHWFADARARKNYAGTSPITRASGTKKMVLARYARNRRLADALQQWAFCCMRGPPGARAYYQALRARGIGHQGALRQLSNRPAGTAASPATPPATSTPPGITTRNQLLDISEHGMSAALRTPRAGLSGIGYKLVATVASPCHSRQPA